MLRNRTVPIRVFFVLWDNIFWQISDAFLLCLKVFGTRYVFETQNGSLTKFFCTVKQKKLTENRDAVPPSPPSINLFPYQKVSETTKGCRMKFFSAVRQNFFRKTVILPPMHQILLYQIFFELQKGSLTKFSALWDYLFSTENWDTLTPAPSSSLNFFFTRSFLKNRRVLLWSFPVMRDKSFSTNALYTPLQCMKTFYIRINLKYRCVHLRNLSALWKKIQARKVISSSYAWNLLYRKSFEIQKRSTRMFVGTMSQKCR